MNDRAFANVHLSEITSQFRRQYTSPGHIDRLFNNGMCTCDFDMYINNQMDRVKRIWYLSTMRAAKVQASLRGSLIPAVSQEEPSDRKPDPWPL